jgi:voltage-gated potassium channel
MNIFLPFEKTVRHLLNNKLRLALLLLSIVPMIGTLGYMLVEGWGFFDALYMTVITMATIGYGEVHPLSYAGRAFTIGFIIVGTGIVAYSLTILVEAIVRPELITQSITKRKIRSMENHYIVCGFGRSGSRIAKELTTIGKPFVVVESNEEAVEHFRQQGGIVIVGDATDEETLRQAGIERANGLVTSLDSDASNIFVVLTARGMNPDLYIVARADQSATPTKLKRAGADAVLSPHEIGAVRMTHLLLRQNVIDAFELVTGKISLDVSVKELRVADYPEFAGKRLETLHFRKRFNVIIFAVKFADETLQFPAHSETVLDTSMTLVVAGASEDVMRLARKE